MGFFTRKKKEATTATTAVTKATTGSARDKKEPLLEQVPGDELPGWTDIDGNKIGAAGNTNDPEAGSNASLSPYYQERVEAEKFLKQLWEKVKAGFLWLVGCGGAITVTKLALWGVGAAALLTVGLLTSPAPVGRKVNVAFIGNSYFFVNDLPRLMETVTGGNIHQDSCLHGSGSLLNILKTGNGMYYKWQSKNAMKGGVEWTSSSGNANTYLYDYGACSVPQLLTGTDEMLSYQNQYGHYISDGTNPCLVNQDYLDWENSRTNTKKWDFVVMVDQSKRMAFDDARQEGLMAFNYTYGPLLSRSSAVPIIVQPHGFWSEQVNMTGLTDVPTFTSLTLEGAQIYRDFLNEKMGKKNTRIAPVGNAYLAVYEADRDLWAKLFLDDGIHPSAHGSYLYAMVIHATMYKSMPSKGRVINKHVDKLFANSRKLHSDTMPSKKEARKLWKIARKVAVYGHKPKSLKRMSADLEYVEETDDQIEDTEEDEYYDQPVDDEVN